MPWKPVQIPTVYPIAGLKVKESGRTRPMEMECQTADGNKSYIVKLWNNVELNTHSLAREVYGSLLADYFEIPTPEIAFVDIDPDFGMSQPDPIICNSIMASPGLNFGSKYINGAITFSPPVPQNRLAEATKIYCFDILIGNSDRRFQKENMFSANGKFIVFDHEQAFPQSMPHLMLFGAPTAWDFAKEQWSKDHILYSSLKGRDLLIDIEGFITDLERLKDNILDKIENSIPAEWNKNVNNISNHLAKTRDNAKLFKRCLQELLA